MRAHRILLPRAGVVLVGTLALLLAGCGQSGPTTSSSSSSSSSADNPASSSSSSGGNPACDLITPAIAAKVDPGQVPMSNSPARPGGSGAYGCGYYSRSVKGNGLSVALTTPASAADIAAAKKTPDCAPVTGIGDFACFQWTGYFRGEPSASANTILMAVRGNESLDFRYLAMPPMDAGTPAPDGNATARALSQALVDAGWGNGSALSVPSAPAVGPQASTNNPVCAIATADAVKQAFGATTTPETLPGEGSCRYTFGALGTPGPDSLIFSIEYHQGGASMLTGALPPDGQSIEGVGDKAILVTRSEAAGPKSLRPVGDVPITILMLEVAKGQNMAIFVAQVLISPTGPTADQTKDQLLGLARNSSF
ncbi:hypothetical protein RBS60_04160 [Sinomonas sp. ASV486]|uniref:hypothetical protein n=1 Tax=Sinomonas sp. ASV486 TaxID=3051170 RepID=UPI0027DC8D47|nr:hypothetical protein [Sinomonas sp. ASV486]MDQ4489391.1 hypothetical protein [Sinomonas sp. ASV486]